MISFTVFLKKTKIKVDCLKKFDSIKGPIEDSSLSET